MRRLFKPQQEQVEGAQDLLPDRDGFLHARVQTLMEQPPASALHLTVVKATGGLGQRR